MHFALDSEKNPIFASEKNILKIIVPHFSFLCLVIESSNTQLERNKQTHIQCLQTGLENLFPLTESYYAFVLNGLAYEPVCHLNIRNTK